MSINVVGISSISCKDNTIQRFSRKNKNNISNNVSINYGSSSPQKVLITNNLQYQQKKKIFIAMLLSTLNSVANIINQNNISKEKKQKDFENNIDKIKTFLNDKLSKGNLPKDLEKLSSMDLLRISEVLMAEKEINTSNAEFVKNLANHDKNLQNVLTGGDRIIAFSRSFDYSKYPEAKEPALKAVGVNSHDKASLEKNINMLYEQLDKINNFIYNNNLYPDKSNNNFTKIVHDVKNEILNRRFLLMECNKLIPEEKTKIYKH